MIKHCKEGEHLCWTLKVKDNIGIWTCIYCKKDVFRVKNWEGKK